MNKTELENKKKELEKELRIVNNELYDYEENQKREKYGDKFNCEYCKYNAVESISDHNYCGKSNQCTCCQSFCEDYEPDTEATLLIKQQSKYASPWGRSKNTNGYGQISIGQCAALLQLGANIYDDNMSNYTRELLTLFLNRGETK